MGSPGRNSRSSSHTLSATSRRSRSQDLLGGQESLDFVTPPVPGADGAEVPIHVAYLPDARGEAWDHGHSPELRCPSSRQFSNGPQPRRVPSIKAEVGNAQVENQRHRESFDLNLKRRKGSQFWHVVRQVFYFLCLISLLGAGADFVERSAADIGSLSQAFASKGVTVFCNLPPLRSALGVQCKSPQLQVSHGAPVRPMSSLEDIVTKNRFVKSLIDFDKHMHDIELELTEFPNRAVLIELMREFRTRFVNSRAKVYAVASELTIGLKLWRVILGQALDKLPPYGGVGPLLQETRAFYTALGDVDNDMAELATNVEGCEAFLGVSYTKAGNVKNMTRAALQFVNSEIRMRTSRSSGDRKDVELSHLEGLKQSLAALANLATPSVIDCLKDSRAGLAHLRADLANFRSTLARLHSERVSEDVAGTRKQINDATRRLTNGYRTPNTGPIKATRIE
jgi:hypothetical protein